jgi:hypothetical protein
MSISRQPRIAGVSFPAGIRAVALASFTASLVALGAANAQTPSAFSAATNRSLAATRHLDLRMTFADQHANARAGLRQALTAKAAVESAPKSGTCFTMRSYRFKRDPNSDAVAPAGSSTCQDATQFQMKNAVVVPVKSR